MSASNEKDRPQGQEAGGSHSNPKSAREAKQRQEARRTNLLYGTIAVVFVLISITVIAWNANVVERMQGNTTAATINGEECTVPQVSYYFTNIYQNFVSQASSNGYLSYLGLDTNADLRDQTYGDETWFDYFMGETMTQMSAIFALEDAAQAAGLTWNDEMQAQFDENMTGLSTNAAANGLSAKKYLRQMYGLTMSQDVYETEMRRVILASTFSQNYSDSLTYTDAELEAEYAGNPNRYDVVNYESVSISGAAPSTTDAEGNTVEATEAESAAALEQAKTLADEILASFQAGEASLEELADNEESATYLADEAASYSSGVLMDWLFDDARTAGDCAVLENTDSSIYYVVSFSDRTRQDYNTVDVRHILIQPESGSIASGEDGYDEEQAQLKADARQEAEALLAQWESGEATEDSFAALANEHSSDGGSNTAGGLYEGVYQGQMVPSFNDWCFDSSRKTGDTDIVETDYGFHIMYFVGQNQPYWQTQATSTLRNAEYEEWYNGITEPYTGEVVEKGAQYLA